MSGERCYVCGASVAPPIVVLRLELRGTSPKGAYARSIGQPFCTFACLRSFFRTLADDAAQLPTDEPKR